MLYIRFMRLTFCILLLLVFVMLAPGCKKTTHPSAGPAPSWIDSVAGSYVGTMEIIHWSALVGFPPGSTDSSYPTTISFSKVSTDSFSSGGLATSTSGNLKYDSTGMYVNVGYQGDVDTLLVFTTLDSIHYVYRSSDPVNGGAGGSFGIIKIFSGKK
jgi:hypothetical protein